LCNNLAKKWRFFAQSTKAGLCNNWIIILDFKKTSNLLRRKLMLII
jgi:hypothetical protein